MKLITPIIERKRDGYPNSKEELEQLMAGYLSGEVKDYQMSAWLMAVCLNGMDSDELSTWTELMWKSGKTFPRAKQTSFWVDKHSTGGVGDKPSLLLVPWVLATAERLLGKGKVEIPMVSGRGLGHSGGTLDKLESVPGFSSSIDIPTAMDLLEKNHFFMMGQTQELAPADRKLYALRDVTGTVESIPLIVSSIMSKKLSENLNGIVFDVKTGQGAFMPSLAKAKVLAKTLVGVSKSRGLKAIAVLTQMDEPLGYCVGNFLEVKECYEFLTGVRREKGLMQVTLTLALHMLQFASPKKLTDKKAKDLLMQELDGTRVLELFQLMFTAQGGRLEPFDQLKANLMKETSQFTVLAPINGSVSSISCREFGFLLVELGGGRKTKDSGIHPYVGFDFHKKRGDAVERGDTVLTVYCGKDASHEKLKNQIEPLIQYSKKKVKKMPRIVGTLK